MQDLQCCRTTTVTGVPLCSTSNATGPPLSQHHLHCLRTFTVAVNPQLQCLIAIGPSLSKSLFPLSQDLSYCQKSIVAGLLRSQSFQYFSKFIDAAPPMLQDLHSLRLISTSIMQDLQCAGPLLLPDLHCHRTSTVPASLLLQDLHCCSNSIIIATPLSQDLNVSEPPLSQDSSFLSASTVPAPALFQELHCHLFIYVAD